MPTTAKAAETIKVITNKTVSIHIINSTLVVMSNNTNSAESEIPTKVVNIQNATKVGRIFF
jgi:hypothetical protein